MWLGPGKRLNVNRRITCAASEHLASASALLTKRSSLALWLCKAALCYSDNALIVFGRKRRAFPTWSY